MVASQEEGTIARGCCPPNTVAGSLLAFGLFGRFSSILPLQSTLTLLLLCNFSRAQVSTKGVMAVQVEHDCVRKNARTGETKGHTRHACSMIESCNHRTRKRLIHYTSVCLYATSGDCIERYPASNSIVRGWTRLRGPIVHVPRWLAWQRSLHLMA
jgi:hypothetical protein